jgi:hypothetical protein
MADRKGAAAGARRRPLARLGDIHRICGQVCGQAACIVGKAAFLQPLQFAAQNFGNEKCSRINGLRQYVGFVTGVSR